MKKYRITFRTYTELGWRLCIKTFSTYNVELAINDCKKEYGNISILQIQQLNHRYQFKTPQLNN